MRRRSRVGLGAFILLGITTLDLVIAPRVAPDEGQLGLFLGSTGLASGMAAFFWAVTSPLETPAEGELDKKLVAEGDSARIGLAFW